MAITETELIQKYKKMLGLINVDNTNDVNKPLSLAARNALNGKLGLTGGSLTGALTGTTGIFSNDIISNTSGYTSGISMLSLYTELTSLISLITSFRSQITSTSEFPIAIPYSYTTIDQISNSSGSTGSTNSPYYICSDVYIPVAMTSMNTSFSFFGAWGIKRSVVDRNVWMNNWTFVTKLWFNPKLTKSSPNICDRIVVKFGEDWDRWDKGSDGVNNRGDQYTTSIDPNKNKYLMINNPTSTTTVTLSNNMDPTSNNINAQTIAPFWTLWFMETDSVSGVVFNGGVYIVISYNSTSKNITINFCIATSGTSPSNITSYINANTSYDFGSFDTRPFHIYVNGGIPYWYFGMVLFNNSDRGLSYYVREYKRKFSIIY